MSDRQWGRRELLRTVSVTTVGGVSAATARGAAEPDLSLSLDAEKSTLEPGETVDVTVTATNQSGTDAPVELEYHFIGLCACTGVAIDIIPPDLRIANGAQDTYTQDSVSAGESITFSTTLLAPDDLDPGNYNPSFAARLGSCPGGGSCDPEEIPPQFSASTAISVQQPKQLDLSVKAGTAPLGGTYTLTYTIENTGSATIGDGDNSRTGVSPEFNPGPPGFTTNEGAIVDRGAVDGFTWFDWTIDPGETLTAELQVALEQPGDGGSDPGDYEFTIVAEDTAQRREFDRASETVTVTDSGQNRFDPKTHGFDFANWGLDGGGFTPPHEHNSITEEAFRAEFDQEWLPEIKNSIAVPLPRNIVTEAFEATYDTLRRGPEQLWSDGHCYGMCIVAEKYFQTSPPDSLPNDPATAASIDKPSGEYEQVGTEIDQEHREQYFDSRVLKEAENLGPRTPQAEGTIDAEAEVKAIRSTIERDGTALVGIGSSPSFYASISGNFTRRLHQLIATGVTVNGSSLEEANTATIEVYDPNQPATFYKTNSRQLTVDVSTPTPQPIMNSSGAGYTGLYQRFGLIGPARSNFLPTFKLSKAVVTSFISNFTDGFIIFAANSPIRIDATAPDGTQLNHPDGTVEGVPPEEVVYLSDAPVGEYEITVEGTGSGAYGIEGVGSVPNAGQIETEYGGRISAGETQRLSTTLPEQGEESGTITGGGSGLTGIAAEYDANNDGTITASELGSAVTDFGQGELTASELGEVVTAFGQS
jgi:hypothetical protein